MSPPSQQARHEYKVIFLDIDGVLHAADERQRPCRKPCMDVLRSIVEQSQAHICLSSNWRLDDWGLTQVNKHLRLHDLKPIVGFTHPEEDYFNTRADEVLDYLHKHPEVTHFVVLDDVELNFEDPSATVPTCIASHSVQTDETKGLQTKDVAPALACLERPIDRSQLVPAKLYGGSDDEPPVLVDEEVAGSTEDVVGAMLTPSKLASSNASSNNGSFKRVGGGMGGLGGLGGLGGQGASRNGSLGASRNGSLGGSRNGSRNASCTLLTQLAEDELLKSFDAAQAAALLGEVPSAGLRRVGSSRVSLNRLSRRSSRGDLEGLIRD